MTLPAPVLDRLAKRAPVLLGALKRLLLLSFLMILAGAGARADAAETTCTGRDLLAELAAKDPQTLERMRAQAASTENGSSLLWKIEKEGIAPSYLFGTMHVADPRVLDLPERVRDAFNKAGTLAIETTDVLDESKMLALMAQHPDLLMFTDTTTLTSLLSPQERQTVENGLKRRGISLASVNKMKPWMLAAMLATPACEMARRAGGQPVLDAQLALDAKAGDKAVVGLETGEDQLSAMASLPMTFHLQSLIDTLALGDRLDDVNETMIVLYLKSEIALLWPLLQHVLPEADADGYAAFEQALITKRNDAMAERATPILAKGNVFIAVGALHLPGANGLVAQLKLAGYRLEPVLLANPVPASRLGETESIRRR